jgi:hypothetical protein
VGTDPQGVDLAVDPASLGQLIQLPRPELDISQKRAYLWGCHSQGSLIIQLSNPVHGRLTNAHNSDIQPLDPQGLNLFLRKSLNA